MKSKKIIVILILVLLLAVTAAVLFVFGGRKAVTQEGEAPPAISRQELENILLLSKATFGYPKMMDADARADDARITEDNEFEIFVTLVKINHSQSGYEADLEKLKATLPGSACEKKSLKFLLYKGITARLTFKSNDGVDLFSYVLKPGICP